jgi:hypothetical protein
VLYTLSLEGITNIGRIAVKLGVGISATSLTNSSARAPLRPPTAAAGSRIARYVIFKLLRPTYALPQTIGWFRREHEFTHSLQLAGVIGARSLDIDQQLWVHDARRFRLG